MLSMPKIWNAAYGFLLRNISFRWGDLDNVLSTATSLDAFNIVGMVLRSLSTWFLLPDFPVDILIPKSYEPLSA